MNDEENGREPLTNELTGLRPEFPNSGLSGAGIVRFEHIIPVP
jgi:hypothetical protein